jgi:OOP family OmpA-OmpF porin
MASGLAACANQNGTTPASSSGTPQTASIVSPPPKSEPAAPQDLRLYFDAGRSQVRADSRAVLDQAARLFREGDPLVMTVSGQADTSGDPRRNLLLSQERAASVARGLMDRGIPASRLQLIAKGESEPLVKTADNVAQPENRAVIITWRK